MTRRACRTIAGLLMGGCREAPAEPPVTTFALTPPELTAPAFEPHLTIDPDHPDRIVVAAQYGVSRNLGGRRIWSWLTADVGKTWSGSALPLPDPTATMAADAVTAFGVDGAALVSYLFADSGSFKGGAALARSAANDLGLGPSRVVVRDRLDQGGGAVDKDWLAVDRSRISPLFGSIYLTWHYNRPLPDRTVESALWLSQSRDGGTTWSPPVRAAPHFGGQVAVRSTGTLDLVFGDRDGHRLFHTSSDDGGATFAPPDTVAGAPSESVALDLPSVTVTGGDTSVVCWNQGPRAALVEYSVLCSRMGAGSWGPPLAVVPRLTSGRSTGYGVVAGAGPEVWVLLYAADSARTDVALYRSTDRARTFARHAVLASRPFGLGHFCPAAGAPCRRGVGRGDWFFPGDYVGLSAVPGLVAAAFTLPDGDRPTDRPTIYLSLVRPQPVTP